MAWKCKYTRSGAARLSANDIQVVLGHKQLGWRRARVWAAWLFESEAGRASDSGPAVSLGIVIKIMNDRPTTYRHRTLDLENLVRSEETIRCTPPHKQDFLTTSRHNPRSEAINSNAHIRLRDWHEQRWGVHIKWLLTQIRSYERNVAGRLSTTLNIYGESKAKKQKAKKQKARNCQNWKPAKPRDRVWSGKQMQRHSASASSPARWTRGTADGKCGG